MSDPAEMDADSARADAGCVMLIGIAVTAIAVGHLFGAAWGWLLIGLSLAALGLFVGLRG